MPSRSPSQARLMAAVAHGWRPSRVEGPPASVAREFNRADEGGAVLSRAARSQRRPARSRSSRAGALRRRAARGRRGSP